METWTEIWFGDEAGFYFKGVWLVSDNEDFKLGFRRRNFWTIRRLRHLHSKWPH